VIQANGRPILKLPDRQERAALPYDWVPVHVEGKAYEAKFAKIAVNVIRPADSEDNHLAQLVRRWFGPDAGQPGTAFHVQFEPRGDGEFDMKPVIIRDSREAVVWERYSREEIPPLWGLVFNRSWQQGFLVRGSHVFLLVTLEKKDMPADHRFEDKFLSAARFQWQSQNQTRKESGHGQIIRHHKQKGFEVHLFVRPTRLLRGKAAPFHYCGDLEFDDWGEEEKPITVWWRLLEPVPAPFHGILHVPPPAE
jgi:hypothetical protein